MAKPMRSLLLAFVAMLSVIVLFYYISVREYFQIQTENGVSIFCCDNKCSTTICNEPKAVINLVSQSMPAMGAVESAPYSILV